MASGAHAVNFFGSQQPQQTSKQSKHSSQPQTPDQFYGQIVKNYQQAQDDYTKKYTLSDSQGGGQSK